jgi:excisionase family DNA binding protein
MSISEFITTDEASQLLRIKRQTLYKWICERKIPSYHIGGRTLFCKQELTHWLESKRRKPL